MSKCATIHTITVGLIVDYFPPNIVVDINNDHLTGMVTQVFERDGLDYSDCHLMIGADVVTIGGFIRYPSVKEKWSVTHPFISTSATDEDHNDLRYDFVPGALKYGLSTDIRRISTDYTKMTNKARYSFEAMTESVSGLETDVVTDEMVRICCCIYLCIHLLSHNRYSIPI